MKSVSVRALVVRASTSRASAPFLGALLASTMLAGAPQAQAQTVVNGNGGTGLVVTGDSALSSTNTNIVGPNLTVGNSLTKTIYTNFSTTGGSGSGGGAGLGGVFFVDSNASLTLDNVSLTNNTVTGGQGGGVKVESVGSTAFSLAGASADASALSQFQPTVALQVGGGGVQITSFTLAQQSSLFGVGSGVGVAVTGQTTTVSSTVSSTTLNGDGSELVSLSTPITLSPGQGVDVVNYSSGNFSFQNGNSAVNIQKGMEVLVQSGGVGATYTIASVTSDSSGNVSSFTLQDSNGNTVTLPATATLYVVNQQQYDFTRIAASVNGSTTSNTLVSTGPVAGFAPGMTVTGTGVPSGTTVTAVSTATDPNTGATVTTVTLSNAVNLTTATDLKASSNPIVSNNGQAVLNLPSVAGLVVGETISGVGIPTGTTIVSISGNTVTLSNALQQGAVNSISSGALLVSLNPVISSGAGSVQLASVAGLTVGAEITGSSIPANAQITSIVGNTVYYTINANLANSNTGGSLNSLAAPGVAGSNGSNGQTGSSYSATFDNGEGLAGTNGQKAGNGSEAAGGNGGNGGNGSNGSSTNKTLITSTALDTAGLAADFLRTADDGAGLFTIPSVPGDIAHAVVDAAHVVFDITQLVAWQIDEKQGLVALGGGGGQAGDGGNGSDFFGGGAGGNGGAGGQGAESYTQGGIGGAGGAGGAGGFGAGGGDGGAGGAGGTTGHQTNGAAGAGGAAGFGGGTGSTAGLNGQGGSGFGGGIFVRSGGLLTITGNSVFQNNLALAGSSSNGGQAGQSAGADLFIMTGATVNLAPGQGNTITFYDSIADDSLASIGTSSIAAGSGASVHILGGGTVQFFGTDTYSGVTEISGATLEAQDGVGINSLSRILFDGTGAIGNSLSSTTAGVLLSGGTFTRGTGSLPSNVTWTGSGGFAATSSGLTLNLGAGAGQTLQTLVWNQGGFVPNGSTLIFGSDATDATGIVTVNNNINLNGQVGQIAVYHNIGNTGSYDVLLAGKVYGGQLIVNDTGYSGTLLMPAQNSLTGLTLNSGTLSTILGNQTGRLFDPTNGGFVTINGGNLVLGGAEKLNTVSVALGGSLTALGAVTAGSISNTGVIDFAGNLNASSINNSGILMLGGTTTVTTTVVNQSGGEIDLYGDLTAGGTVENDGALNVIGVVSGTPAVETPATRTINTTGFAGASTGVVNLGGISGTVANTLVINQSGASTYAGVFTGGGALTKTGAGDLNLTGASNFTGPLAINGGTLDTTFGGTFASTTDVTVGVSGTYIVGTDDTIHSVTNNGVTTVNANLSLVTLTNTATGTATVNGSLNSSGDVNNAGGMTFAATSTVSVGGALDNTGTLTSSGTLGVTGLFTNDTNATATLGSTGSSTFGSLTNNGTLTASSPLTVTGLVTNSSTGVMTLSAGSMPQFGSLTNSGAITANDYLYVGGAYTQNAGGLTANDGLTTGTFSGAGGSVHLDNSSQFSIFQTGSGTFAGVIDGDGSLSEQGQGTLTLTGVNTYTGPTQISSATLALSGAGSIADSAYVLDDGAFDISATTAGASIKSLAGGGLVNLGAQTLTLTSAFTNFSGVIQGSGGLNVTAGTEVLDGANTYTGTTSITSGASLLLGSTGSIATSGKVVDNGLFDISATSGASITTLSGASTGVVNLGAETLTLTAAGDTFAGGIQGSGGLNVTAGAETLTGTNTYSGNTVISSGATLALSGTGSIAQSANVVDHGVFDISGTTSGAAIITLSGDGAVHLGAQPLSITGASTTFSGVIGGTGELAVTGGTETLSGVNTYTGATYISDGAKLSLLSAGSVAASAGVTAQGTFDISTASAGESIKTLAGSGLVNLGSNTLTLTAAGNIFSGVIQGSGGLTVAAGAEELTGVNTYTGVTTVNAGAALLLANGGSIAASSNVTANGTLDISSTTTGASIKTLSGSGAVGLGTKTLTITNGSTTFAGVISGQGGLTVSGGAETLTGVNTFTGLTTVASGAKLVLTGGGSLANSGDPLVNGVFDISTTSNGASVVSLSGSGSVTLGAKTLTLTAASETFSGVISGSGGGLTVAGGVETLTGHNTYTGPTQINSGAGLVLAGTGSIATSSGVIDNGVFDISGATAGATINTLSGTGSVALGAKTLTIVNGASAFNGTINGTGTLSVQSGSFNFNGAATIGTTTVSGGTFQVGDPTHGAVVTTTGLNVTTGGVLSGFGTVNGPVTNTSGVVAPGAGAAVGTLTVASYTQGANGTLAIQVTPAAASRLTVTGAASLGGTLDLNYAGGPYAPRIYTILSAGSITGGFSNVVQTGLPSNNVTGLYSTSTAIQLVVEPYSAAQSFGAITTTTLDQAQSFSTMITDREASAGCSGDLRARMADGKLATCEGTGVWVSVVGRTEHTTGSSLGTAANEGDGGVIAGVDHRFLNGGSIGVAVAWTENSFSQNSAATHATGDSVFASIYGGLSGGGFVVTGEAFYMNSRWNLKRTLTGYGVASSNPNGDTGGAALQVSYPIAKTGFAPYARLSYADFSRDSTVETGVGIGPLAIAAAGHSTSSARAEAGVSFGSKVYNFSNGVQMTPLVRVGIAQDLASSDRSTASNLVLIQGTNFVAPSVRPDQTSGLVDGAVKIRMTDRFDLSADVRGRLSGNQTEGTLSFDASYHF